MTRLSIIVPTVGRDPELQACLDSFADQLQDGDRVNVICDRPGAVNEVYKTVANLRANSKAVWRVYPTQGHGMYGHPARNIILDLLAQLDDRPDWCWTLDDDDVATFGALDFIRAAIETQAAPWYVFSMVGGDASHFPGVVVPTQGAELRRGNIGTPMIVFPTGCKARFGYSPHRIGDVKYEPGYFGDAEMALALEAELGAPVWRPEIVATVRPEPVTA